jgi:hypothetical protein
MFDRLRSFFDNPYYAPVTEPLKNILRIAAIPLRGFGTVLADSWEGEYTGWPKRFLDEVCRDENGPAGLIAVGGGMVGGAAGFIGAGSLLGVSGGGGIAGTLMLASAGAGIGVIAGPFVMAAAVGAVALTVGCALGIVPGVIMGTVKALKHIFSKKDAPEISAPANDDAVAAETPSVRTVLRGPRTAQEMLQSLSTLQDEERRAFESAMMEKLRPAFEAASAVIMPKDASPAFENKGAAFGKIGKLVV